MKVFTVAQMVAAEKAADAAGVTYAQMMESAGRSVAEAVQTRLQVAEKRVLVLVGPGNNGGDGLVAGRYLAEAGADVAFYLSKPRDPDSELNFARAREMGLLALHAELDQRYRVLRTRLQATDIVVDGLLGTAVSRPISGDLARLMQQVKAGLEERGQHLAKQNRSPLVALTALPGATMTANLPFVVAIDCPSGLHNDTGDLDPVAIPADLTVTFAGPKRGHFRFPAAAACGELVVADIGISPELPEVAGIATEVVTTTQARHLLPERPLYGHKGTFGSVMVAAGSASFWGAPFLAGRAAYRAGAGLVTLAVPAAIRQAIAAQLPEATYLPVAAATMLDEAAAGLIRDSIGAYKALLIGPGLGDAADFLKSLLAAPVLPAVVIDADGLNLLAKTADWSQLLPPDTILTPHPGEMARLMGAASHEVTKADRIELAREKAMAWNAIIVLKGAYTVIAGPDGRCSILPFANPALATAGSGDVLAGIIVALLGQGLEPYDAAVLGGFLHGAAGQLAGVASGLLAGELADNVPQARQRLRGSG